MARFVPKFVAKDTPANTIPLRIQFANNQHIVETIFILKVTLQLGIFTSKENKLFQ
jgi:hypothetical protein